MDNKNRNKLRKIGRDLSPVVRIGKSGITDEIVLEVRRQLKKKKLIKVKYLKSAIDDYNAKELSEILAAKSESDIVNVIGLSVILVKKGISADSLGF